jgi:hypothetical protein
MMTRHCHKCGWEWAITGQPGRGDTCHECNADLKVCLNCLQYDPRAAENCKERRAELVQEKDQSNFCEYFELAKRDYSKKGDITDREDAARDALRNLLGG